MKRAAQLIWIVGAVAGCGGGEPNTVATVSSGDSGAKLPADGGSNPGTDAGTGGFQPPPVTTGGGTGGGTGNNNCLVQPVDVKGQSPDVLIVQDASASMAATRWVPSLQAVNTLTSQYQNTVDFGLAIFPPGGIPSCGSPNLDVPPGPMNAMAIMNALNSTPPLGLTPTAQALEAALTFLKPRNATNADGTPPKPAYVVLATDGQPDCPTLGLDPVAAAQALKDAGIPVYVIGYDIDAIGEGTMNNIAQAGGTDHYYKVNDGASLTAAFDAITKDVVRCDFDLATSTDPDPAYIHITIDGKDLNLSQVDGWVVMGHHITLNGTSCSTLKDGGLHAVNAQIECTPLR